MGTSAPQSHRSNVEPSLDTVGIHLLVLEQFSTISVQEARITSVVWGCHSKRTNVKLQEACAGTGESE